METIFALYHKPSSYFARQGISAKTQKQLCSHCHFLKDIFNYKYKEGVIATICPLSWNKHQETGFSYFSVIFPTFFFTNSYELKLLVSHCPWLKSGTNLIWGHHFFFFFWQGTINTVCSPSLQLCAPPICSATTTRITFWKFNYTALWFKVLEWHLNHLQHPVLSTAASSSTLNNLHHTSSNQLPE